MSLARKIAINAIALTAGRLVMALIGVLSVAIATRYLGVASYGAFVTATAFAAVVSTLTDVGLWQIGAREIAKRPHDMERIVGSILTVGIALSLGAALLAVGLAFLMYRGADHELVRRGILLLMLTVPLAAPFGAVGAYFVSQQKAYMGMLGGLTGSVTTVILLLLASAFDWGFDWIVLAYVWAAVAQGAVMIAVSVGKVSLRPSLDTALARDLFVWALPVGGAMLLHSIYWRVDLLILSLLKPESEVALYGLAFRVLDAVVALPGFVMVTLMPEFARLASERQHFDEIVQKAFSVMQVGTVPVVVLFVAFASEIVRMVGGTAFAGATVVLQVLMAAIAFTYLGSVLWEAFLALNRQKQAFYVVLSILPFNIILNVGFITLWGARGAALAFAISEGLALCVMFLLYRKFAGAPRPHRPLRVLFAACAMGAVGALKLLPFVNGASPALVLSLGVPLSLCVYIACLYALGAMPRELHDRVVLPLQARLRPG